MKALSIIQPWAWLIAHGHKDIENRSWPTRYRGPVLIHAGKKFDWDVAIDLKDGVHPVTGEACQFAGAFGDEGQVPGHAERGGIVGQAEIVGCVTSSSSPWFVGTFGFVIANARPLPFRPCRGALGFFDPLFEGGS